MSHSVYGNGYHSTMRKDVIETSVSLFIAKYERSHSKQIDVRPQDYLQMVFTKRYMNSKMSCDGDNCFYDADIKPIFSYWLEESITDYSCTVSPKLVSATHIKDNLFHSNCKVGHKFCDNINR